MKYVNDTMQAVVIMACEKHAPAIMEKLKECQEGNWFAMTAIQACRMGYWNNVYSAHEGQGCAVFGFAERVALSTVLGKLTTLNPDGSSCQDCVAYGWDITPSHIVPTAKDPVCGANVDCATGLTHAHDGELFFFCSVNCRDKFHKNPQSFVHKPELQKVG